MRRAISLALLALTLAAGSAAAQTYYYKWIDADGKVQFSDKPPAGFKGEVSKVLVDTPADAPPPRAPAAAPKAPAATEESKDKASDIGTRRRQQREMLAARLAAAREKVEVARKALADGDGTTESERQFVRQEFPRNARSPEKTPPPRDNCTSQRTTDGKAVWNCPRPIPNESYFERQRDLEEALRKAEDELAEAERAYRRGVD